MEAVVEAAEEEVEEDYFRVRGMAPVLDRAEGKDTVREKATGRTGEEAAAEEEEEVVVEVGVE